jgi:hypothetical protein
MRIILSRKGFDSSAGGVPSPIFPDGRLCSLPIPTFPREEEKTRYSQVSWEWEGKNLGDIVEQLTKDEIRSDHGVHLDPDINPQAVLRCAGWQPIFGQTGAAESHLKNRGVDVGDVFLFFGWFKRVEVAGGKVSYVAKAPDLHVLFGWMQIGEIHRVDDVPTSMLEWARYHPHFGRCPDCLNTVYIAKAKMDLPGMTSVPGAGLFRQFRPQICLTVSDSKRSQWFLPSWFYPPNPKFALSYHSAMWRWQRERNGVYLKSASRGQEFVLDCSHYPHALEWLKGLLDHV